jgi:LemA protein
MSILAAVAILLAVVGFLTYAVIIYNELVRLRNDNNRAWANIDVLLKQRHEEIPNLVSTVRLHGTRAADTAGSNAGTLRRSRPDLLRRKRRPI